MYADRSAPRRLNRGSLSLSVAIVGSLMAAVMVSNTTILRPAPDEGIEIYTPRIDPPPPPDPKVKPQPHSKRETTITAPDPIPDRPTEPDAPYVALADPGPPPSPPGAADDLGGGAAVEPVKPPPVITGTEVDPRYAHAFQPAYPPAEQRAGRDGVVTLKVLVGIDGRVVRAEQVLATSEEFWRVTLKQALGKWRFKPATRDGVPFEAWRTMTVRFRLQDG